MNSKNNVLRSHLSILNIILILLMFVLSACGDVTVAPVQSSPQSSTTSSPNTSVTSTTAATSSSAITTAENITTTAKDSVDVVGTPVLGLSQVTPKPMPTQNSSSTTNQVTLVTYNHPYFSLQLGSQWIYDKALNLEPYLVNFSADERRVSLDVFFDDSADAYKKDSDLLALKKSWTSALIQTGSSDGIFAVADDSVRTVPPTNPSQPYENIAARCLLHYPYPHNTGEYELSLGTDYRGAQFQYWLAQFKLACESLQPGSEALKGTSVKSLKTVVDLTPLVPSNSAKYGGKLVFSTENKTIYVINPDGTKISPITHGYSPVFSPDGKMIAFGDGIEGQFTGDYMDRGVYTTNLDGSSRQLICDMGTEGGEPLRWSPRSRFIAGTGSVGAGPGKIYLCNLATKKPEQLFGSQYKLRTVIAFDWTIDGNYAIWQAFTNLAANIGQTANAAIFYGDPDKNGAAATKLTDGQYLDDASQDTRIYKAIRISPDGKTIAVLGSKIFFLSVPGQTSSLAGKTFDVKNAYISLAWSPDGKALATLICADSNCTSSNLAIVDIASGKVTPLAQNVTAVDWSRQ